MAFSLIAQQKIGAAGGNSATTAGVDTTGANILFIAVASFNTDPSTATVTDSKGNTYSHITSQAIAGNIGCVLFYSVNPTVGAGHTVTVALTGGFVGISFQAWSGGATSSPLDQQNGNAVSDTNTTIQPGSITPGQDNELVLTVFGEPLVSSTGSIDSGFSTPYEVAFSSGQNVGVALSYKIQTSAAAVNPTWTASSGGFRTAIQASFKAAPGGMICVITGAATVVANLTGTGALIAAITGSATVVANLTGIGALAAAITGSSTVVANLTGIGVLNAAITGSATVIANLTGIGNLAAVISGTATVIANLTNAGSGVLAAIITGSATVVASLTGTGALVAAIPASSTVVANLTAFNPSGAIIASLFGTSALVANLSGPAAGSPLFQYQYGRDAHPASYAYPEPAGFVYNYPKGTPVK